MTKITPKVEREFLGLTAKGVPMVSACRQVGVSRMAIYRKAKRCKTFTEAWEEAQEEGRLAKVAEMEDAADERGIKGYLEPVYYKGKPIGAKRRYSDTLLLARLKAEAPEKYGDKRDKDDDATLGNVTINVQRIYE